MVDGAVPDQPQAFAFPNSLSFTGPGNLLAQPVSKPAVKPRALTRAQKLAAALRACRKKAKGKKRVACERQARRRYGPLKVKKAGRGARRTK